MTKGYYLLFGALKSEHRLHKQEDSISQVLLSACSEHTALDGGAHRWAKHASVCCGDIHLGERADALDEGV